DGAGADARFRGLGALAAAAPGRLILADSGNALVRIIAAPSRIGFHAPPSPRLDPRFDADAFRWQPLLWPIDPMDGPHEIAGTMGEARGGESGERVKPGARFTTADVIGTVNAFNHVHLNVGWPGEERNPLLFRLVQFEDTVPPTIARGGVRLYDEAGGLLKERVKGRLVVRARV